jgi:hypothetical protein
MHLAKHRDRRTGGVIEEADGEAVECGGERLRVGSGGVRAGVDGGGRG